jgi:hypothetical protein
MVLGAGLAPGLSTVLVSTVRSRPDDALDVTIMVGSGDKHGVAAMAWIARLVGTEIADSCDVGGARNFREHRWFGEPGGRRRYLRADFPDHTLVCQSRCHPSAWRRWPPAGGGPWNGPTLTCARNPYVGEPEWIQAFDDVVVYPRPNVLPKNAHRNVKPSSIRATATAIGRPRFGDSFGPAPRSSLVGRRLRFSVVVMMVLLLGRSRLLANSDAPTRAVTQ